MAKKPNLQDSFLAVARKEKIPVTVFMVNGFQMRGIVSAFDVYTVLISGDGKQNLIFKHAISTITPLQPVMLPVLESDDSADEAAELP